MRTHWRAVSEELALERMAQLRNVACMAANPFRYFKTSPEIIRLAVMLSVRFPLSLRNVEDLLHERGIDVRAVSEELALECVAATS